MGKTDVLPEERNFLIGECRVFMTRSLGLKICPFVLCFVLFFFGFFSASKQRAVSSDNPQGGFISPVFFFFVHFLLFTFLVCFVFWFPFWSTEHSLQFPKVEIGGLYMTFSFLWPFFLFLFPPPFGFLLPSREKGKRKKMCLLIFFILFYFLWVKSVWNVCYFFFFCFSSFLSFFRFFESILLIVVVSCNRIYISSLRENLT